MSVSVNIRSSNLESREYNAALSLKRMFDSDIPASAEGTIDIVVSVTMLGQEVKDIDLLVIGKLSNCTIHGNFAIVDKESGKTTDYSNTPVFFNDFCAVVEVKDHDSSSVFRDGTDLFVIYDNVPKNVTEQSNKQKTSAMSFFNRVFQFSPYITNLIFFTQLTNADISRKMSLTDHHIPSNAFGCDVGFKQFVNLIFLQRPPKCNENNRKFSFSADSSGLSEDNIDKISTMFARSKEQAGELTRKRIELISQKAFAGNEIIEEDGKVSIYRGRAGTGKTVGLIQTAIRLVDEKQARVLMLTYNLALVSDIRRLFALAEMPDMFDSSCVSVSTIHSYMLRLVNNLLYDGQMKGEKFVGEYEAILNELDSFLSDSETIELAKDSIASDQYLDWDYVLIDEAQDWSNKERDIILKLFDSGRIVLADGGVQFVRRGDGCDWGIIKNKNNIKLKTCLRQKENLIRFLNEYNKQTEVLGSKIVSNGKLLGGKVIITTNDKLFEVHNQEIEKLKMAGNIAYDMLYLVPPTLVSKGVDGSHFSQINKFAEHGIKLWDGTSRENRATYSIDPEEVRLLQYESSRGLEGWTVVCIDFDMYLKMKEKEYVEKPADPLLLESVEDVKKRYLYNWAMIPLTRAIDTLVISLNNPNSEIGLLLKKIYGQCHDFVSWI